jgi:predicted PilT family ATPase
MVSTDSEGPNKYDEYIVMVVVDDDNIETRFVEQVGSWDIDLSDYATVDALATKVDKRENYDLVPTEEIVKLLSVAKGAESNIINSVSSNFKIDELNNR